MADDNKNSITVQDTANNKIGSVLAKLSKNTDFGRGDFLVVQPGYEGIVLTDMLISDADIANKGVKHKPGEYFYINNYPKSNIGKNQLLVNNPVTKGLMSASRVPVETDSVDKVARLGSKNLLHTFKALGKTLLNGGPGGTCNMSPASLKEAVDRLMDVGTGQEGDKYRLLPPNAKKAIGRAKKKLADSGYIEFDENGSMSLTANAGGVTIDDKGNVYVDGDKIVNKEIPSNPHALSGIPTNKSWASQAALPNTIVGPMGLGPLALDRLPDFSFFHWALNIFDALSAVADLAELIDDAKSSGVSVSSEVEKQQAENKLKNKIN